MTGYIYVMQDQHLPCIIKVGYSKDPLNRVKQLFRTGNPTEFYLDRLWLVSDMKLAEKIAHSILSENRINPRREFFDVCPEQYFSVDERNDRDFISDGLDGLLEKIEESWASWGVTFERLIIEHTLQAR